MLPSRAAEQIEMIVRNISLEARLIDDLLDLTRIVRGNLALRLEPGDAHVLLRQTREIVESEIAARRLHLSEDCAATEIWIEADATRLQQVFWNLLRNAIKFTPPGGEIRVSTRNEAGQLVVEVADAGIGIAPEMCARILAAHGELSAETGTAFGSTRKMSVATSTL